MTDAEMVEYSQSTLDYVKRICDYHINELDKGEDDTLYSPWYMKGVLLAIITVCERKPNENRLRGKF